MRSFDGTGSKVLYLSHFSNFVLLASFLGISAGFLRARSSRNLFQLAPLLLAILVAFVLGFPVQIERSGDELMVALVPWLRVRPQGEGQA